MSQNNGTEIIDGTLYYKCNEIIKNGFKCIYKCKRTRDLKIHKQNIHDIGVKWHVCDFVDENGVKCIYKSKELSKSRDLILDEYNIREVIYKKIQEIKDIIYR